MVFRFAGFELDEQRAELRRPDGAPVKLRPKSFEMLRLLAENPGRVLSKHELMDTVWPNVHVSEDGLFQCIREIRTALRDERRQMIKLVSGRGYLFDMEVSAGDAANRPVDDDDALPSESDIPAAPFPPAAPEEVPAEPQDPAASSGRVGGTGHRWGRPNLMLLTALVIVAGFAMGASALFRVDGLFGRSVPAVAVLRLVATDGEAAGFVGGVTDRLVDGFAKIGSIRVVTPLSGAETVAGADFTLQGEVARDDAAWLVRARLVRAGTGEVIGVASASVPLEVEIGPLQLTRLAAGVGDPLARRLNEVLEAGTELNSEARAAIEQSAAAINRTSRERFVTAQSMLEGALASAPDNTDVQVALASLQLRGIMMVWYDPAETLAAERNARGLLERAVHARPQSLAALDAFCRLLVATNQFVDALVTCARALNLDPWNGSVLYNIGLAQLRLGRFDDALATFEQADRFNTPEVSRWTWLLGAGWVSLLMGENAAALGWLERSIAITPASGRSYFLLAVANQRLGREAEARAAFVRAMELRPGSTAQNLPPSQENSSALYLERTRDIMSILLQMGLPPA